VERCPPERIAAGFIPLRRVIRVRHLGATDHGDLSGLENPAAIEKIAQAR
jgi:hypothetical protein